MPKLKSTAVLIAALFSTVLLVRQAGRAQSEQPSPAFTEADASKLLSQVAEGLQGHSSRKMLGTFDLSRMDGSAQFKEQITSFFNQYETIRVHFKLVQVKDDEATVDAEMDGTPRNAITAPEHKRLQLRFIVAKTAAGWKFVDVQPRGFFS